MKVARIVKALWTIKKDMAASPWPSGPGLCALIETELELYLTGSTVELQNYTMACRAVRNAMAAWPEHSGSRAYPVKPPTGYTYHGLTASPGCAYADLPRWHGEYGGSRMRLLNFLIRYFEERQDGQD